MIAGGIAFYGILALVPAIASFVALYGYFSNPASLSSQLRAFSQVLPEGALNAIGDEVKQAAGRGCRRATMADTIGDATGTD